MCPSYFFSQWEMCSTSTDSFVAGMAFSTGMTCMPTPAPPGGTMQVIFVSGRNDMRSKNCAISGCPSTCCRFMFISSAEPGTKIGSVHCLW